MPLIAHSSYAPRWLFRHAHTGTIYPTMARSVAQVPYSRERLKTPDNDFIDVDFLFGGFDKIVILCHGLEGNAHRHYMQGMARYFHKNGWDVAAMNFRGCSGEPNITLRSYHSGATEDLQVVLSHIADKGYQKSALIGFSLGGNLILKYLGEAPEKVWSRIYAAVTFSAPIDLGDAGEAISSRKNWVYNKRFLLKLEKKIHQKEKLFPEDIDIQPLKKIKTLADFDHIYTGPLHGFSGAEDYYSQCSSRQFLPSIKTPTLLVSATNDPFLGENCYPHPEAKGSDSFFFENPDHGGHVGFFSPGDVYWSEARALEFIQAQMP